MICLFKSSTSTLSVMPARELIRPSQKIGVILLSSLSFGRQDM